MKIFITGCAGFLGSHLADAFLQKGYSVAGNDNLIGGDKDHVDPRVTFFECDCCDFEKMRNAIHGSDILIHCAATAHEGLSVFSPSFITQNVLQASVSTISAAISQNVNKIIFCSSMARYGNQALPFEETQPPSPIDPYGIAKVAAESILKSLCDCHNTSWNVVVPHNIVGARQKYNDPFRNVMSIMANRNLQNKPSIIYGDGLQTRCFSHVDDCVNSFVNLVESDIQSEIINIGPDREEISIQTLARKVAAACNYKRDPIYFKDRPLEVKHAYCSSDKARLLLDYETTKTIDNSITDVVEYIQHKGVKPFDYQFPLEIVNRKTPITWKDRLI